jgi:hypothetical protein
LREILRESLASSPDGWLLLPSEGPISADTLGTLRDIGGDDMADQDSDTVLVGGFELAPSVGGDTLHDICQGAQRLQPLPSDETLVEALDYYLRFDAFLPALGAPEPPPFEEINAQIDRAFWDQIGEENLDRPCRREGCGRGSVAFSVLCRVHHFESVMRKPCPFDP